MAANDRGEEALTQAVGRLAQEVDLSQRRVCKALDVPRSLVRYQARLPAKDRAVVVLRYWEDRSIEETAQVMNASSAAVRTRCVRALGRLRELLGEDLGEYARP